MSNSSDHELTVFSAARRLPSDRRTAFLDEACAGDATLRQHVEDLLAAGERAGGFLETPAENFLDPGARLRAAAVPAEKPGDRIGRYQLLEQIGEGGCGTVYRASQEEPVRREVALKVIKLGMDTKSVIARFEAERQALALMDHPNIAKVLDAGATDSGRPYFVMELVRGVKITDCCDQNNLSTRQRLELFLQVCHAIQHAHQKGIIHRDIKPSNILVTQQDGVLVPKVIDFGIAKATHGKLADETFFTALEQFIGTPAYMSPEQAEAGGIDIDTRSDIYSLGVLLYELLTGLTPFDSRELLQAGLDEIRRTIREQEPARPSTRLSSMMGAPLSAIAKHRKTEAPQLIYSVRGDLDWIVMKALEKNRVRRYETANGLAADIRRHLENEPVVARPPSNMYRFQKLVRRHQLVFAAASAIVLALAVGVAISVRATIKERQARVEADKARVEADKARVEADKERMEADKAREEGDIARLQAEANAKKANAEESKSRQVAQFLEDMLNGVGPSVAMGSDTTLLKKILDNTAARIGTDLAQQPEVDAELRYTLGQVYWEIGDLSDAEAMHRQALNIRVKVLGTNDPLVAESMRSLSHVLWRQGRLDEAEKMARDGIDMQRQLFGSTNLEVSRSLEDYSAILNTKGEWIAAVSALGEALATKEALLGHDNLEVADTMDDLAGFCLSINRTLKADEAMARDALAIRRKLLGETNPIVTIATLRMQQIDEDLKGRPGEEEATLYKLVAAEKQFYGNMHPTLAQSLNLLATVLRNEGKLAESEPVRREALAMQQKLLGADSPEVAQTEANLAEVLVAGNKLAEAEPLYRSALVSRQKIFGNHNSFTAVSVGDLGKVLEEEGKVEEATNFYMETTGDASAAAAAAEFRLGAMYLHGTGVPEDVDQAAKWIHKSADLWNLNAEVTMGVLYFDGKGVPKDENEALKWFVRASSPANPLAMKTLAECYCANGHAQEAIATMKQIADANPKDTDAWLTLATWQIWFGRENDYETTRRRMLQLAKGTGVASVAQSTAKAFCLRPSTDADLLGKALDLGRLGAELRKDSPWLPWYQLSFGLAEYRNGKYEEAEQTLTMAGQTAGKFNDIPAPARFFCAMSLFQRGHTSEAKDLFSQAEAQMRPLPPDPQKPVLDGDAASHDVMIGWLAYKEAKALIFGTESKP